MVVGFELQALDQNIFGRKSSGQTGRCMAQGGKVTQHGHRIVAGFGQHFDGGLIGIVLPLLAAFEIEVVTVEAQADAEVFVIGRCSVDFLPEMRDLMSEDAGEFGFIFRFGNHRGGDADFAIGLDPRSGIGIDNYGDLHLRGEAVAEAFDIAGDGGIVEQQYGREPEHSLFVPQSFDGIKPRCFEGRPEAREKADGFEHKSRGEHGEL